ncbi:restriction endonuclease [Marinilabilia salmonicolor]|uniref:restriction endonuclease n=1 Tax=Marinilabilia salmonicolor TaxID=989 RepID=UPI00029B185A|nr:ATP-binding protein [Marinilabilia salmonicolor]
MNQYPLILKESGESQPFLPSKLKASLYRAGAESTLIDEITNEIESWLTDGTTTKQIYRRAFSLLRKKRRSMAARYSLKKAIMELGPSGYPFEHFIGHIFRFKGFDVEVGQTVNGKCVTHEVDVIASDEENQHLVECKYHNSQGKFSSVQVPLYIRSRVNDIIETRQALPEYKDLRFHGWVVTNTRFTSDAMDYGRCSGLNLMSWDYPEKDSLKELVEKFHAFPVTTLTQLTKAHKQHLLNKGIVLCSELNSHQEELDALQIPAAKQRKIMMELEDLCDGKQ